MSDDPNGTSNDDLALDAGVTAALRGRYGKAKASAGREPERLEEIAAYVDGTLGADERKRVEARLAAEPELRETVAELQRLEGAAAPIEKADRADKAAAPEAEAPKSNVIPLVIPGRSSRVGQAGVGASTSGPGTLRALPVPEPKKSPMRTAILGIGAALALAAILFLVTRPPAQESAGTAGAGLTGKPDAIAIGFVGAGEAVLEIEAVAPGELSVIVATPDGARAAGLCDASQCLVTSDHLPLRAGKNMARAVLGKDLGPCAFVLALTSNGGATSVDPHAAAKALGEVVSKTSCVLESPERLMSVSGARHVAFMKAP